MYVLRLASAIALLILVYTVPCFSHYTLADVIRASPGIADHKPSPLVAPVSGHFVHLNGDWYQIRLFSYEAKAGIPSHPTFREFIERYHQEGIGPKVGPETLFPTDYFAATPAMREEGFNYLLSLRKVEDPKLIRKLKRPRFANKKEGP